MAEYYAQIRSPKKRLMSLQIATFFLSRLSNVNPIRIRSKPNHQVRKKTRTCDFAEIGVTNKFWRFKYRLQGTVYVVHHQEAFKDKWKLFC